MRAVLQQGTHVAGEIREAARCRFGELPSNEEDVGQQAPRVVSAGRRLRETAGLFLPAPAGETTFCLSRTLTPPTKGHHGNATERNPKTT